MNDMRQKRTNPYEDLYIYYLQGLVEDQDEPYFGEDFLGTWVEEGTSFLFFSVPSREVVSELLMRRVDLKLLDDYHFTYEQWHGTGLEPIKIENLLILPPWSDKDTGDGELKIILDPGVVFGTGHHPTTRDCLRAMLYLRRIDQWDRVLDIGTGTGILAIAAAFLGAKKILAFDLNPLCVKTSRKNVHLNHQEETIDVIEGRAEDFVGESFDLVIANIHYEVVASLLEKKGFRKNNWIILSGLMRSQAREIKTIMGRYGFRVIREWDHEMIWYTMLISGFDTIFSR